ncbi:large conductance mechanosensitive channel protein MscL [Clostridium lacusfryxellense]|uniref:large conductance mechanosensitive channel protein MscL n=1 Tax=Clostridium lacusfryxellense TaxID=205328 RepID=UPI001C0B1F65|nr:large conductance mechanosensitive channel protein MscL [Clostridium lacusfryxellense]
MFKDFKAFALKGSIFDLAIAVVIGAAFSKITTSLVKDILTPIIGILVGGVDVSNLSFNIPSYISSGATISIKYGLFIQAIIDFLIIAFSLFIFIKAIQSVKKKEVEKVIVLEDSINAKISNEEKLLIEIRDLLRETK